MNGQTTILNVDDKEINRYTRTRVLRSAGYHVVEAANGTEALRLVGEIKPALVLLDVKMPDMSGFEVCRQIKTNPDFESVFVLQISASLAEASGRVLALEGGADSYLSDPLEPGELLATVNALLRLQRAEVHLRESEERMRLALQAGKGGTWDIDLVTDKTIWSEEHFTLLGYQPNPSGESSFEAWRRTIHPDDLNRILKKWKSSKRRRKLYEDEYRIVRADNGEVRWLSVVGQFFYDESGRAVRSVGVFFDVTERKEAEEEREKLLVREQILRLQAEEANRLKDEFLATVGHELRSPLNSIMGWATIVRENNFDAATMLRAFEVIERSARNQKQIIADILDVSRIISGKLNLDVRPLELASIIQAAVDNVQPAINAKRLKLEAHLEPDKRTVMGDADRIQQIIWNLLSNAVKFTPEEGKIEIALRYRKSHAEICITDNGSGIELEFLPFVFDRFRQQDGKTNRRYSGLGLGLAIVKNLVELHGGSVEATSVGIGQGATFCVRLPFNMDPNVLANIASSAVEIEPEETELRVVTPQRVLGGLRILVVDDEDDVLNLIKFILNEQGAEVFLANSVDKAMEIFNRENLHALVSDIGMPIKDGYDLIRQVVDHGSEKNRDIPTIALTGYAREEDHQRTLQAGFKAYLSKPLEPADLVKKIFELTTVK